MTHEVTTRRRMFFPRSPEVAGELLQRLEAEIAPGESAENPFAHENRARRESGAPLPTVDELGEILEVAFQASLTQEEGRLIPFGVAFITPDGAEASKLDVLRYRDALPFDPAKLTKLAPSGHPSHTLFGVFRDASGLKIWGLVHVGSRKLDTESDDVDARFLRLGPYFLFVRARRPGILSVYFRQSLRMLYLRGEPVFLKHELPLLDVLRGDVHLPGAVASDLADLAQRISALGRGGTILMSSEPAVGLVGGHGIVPPGGFLERARREKDDANSGKRLEGESEPQFGHRRHRLTLAHGDALDAVARLTRIDGVLHLDASLAVLAYGMKIELNNSALVEERSPAGTLARTIPLNDMTGGTRHRSAARFCAAQTGAGIAIVASQDGDISYFAKKKDGNVIAIRPFVLGAGL